MKSVAVNRNRIKSQVFTPKNRFKCQISQSMQFTHRSSLLLACTALKGKKSCCNWLPLTSQTHDKDFDKDKLIFLSRFPVISRFLKKNKGQLCNPADKKCFCVLCVFCFMDFSFLYLLHFN